MSLLALLATKATTITPPPEPGSDTLARWRGALAGPETAPIVLVAAGDSLTDMGGTSMTSTGWTSRLAVKLREATGKTTYFQDAGEGGDLTAPTEPGLHMVNAATSGRTSSNYLTHVPWLTDPLVDTRGAIAAMHPHIVMHMVGMNDYQFTEGAPSGVADNIAYRASWIDKHVESLGGVAPVHLILVEPRKTLPQDAVRPADWWDNYGAELGRIVAESPKNRILVNVDAAFGSESGLRSDDGVHLTDAGYERTAQTVYSTLMQPVQ